MTYHMDGAKPYLNQCLVIVNWKLRNELKWYLNTKLFVQENVFENVACDVAAILSSGRWVNDSAR